MSTNSAEALQIMDLPLEATESSNPVLQEVMRVWRWVGQLMGRGRLDESDPFVRFSGRVVCTLDACLVDVWRVGGMSEAQVASEDGVQSRLVALEAHVATQGAWLTGKVRDPELRERLDVLTRHHPIHYLKMVSALRPTVTAAARGFVFVDMKANGSDALPVISDRPFVGGSLLDRPWAK